MKKVSLFLSFLCCSFSILGQSTISLTFVGRDAVTLNLLSLDSIFINNTSLFCDTSLYQPVTSLTVPVLYVGNELYHKSPGEFFLSQNVPNPFPIYTDVSIYREYGGTLNLVLFDGIGRKIAEYHDVYDKGYHSFRITSSGNKVLILSVFDEKHNKSIKIIGTGLKESTSAIHYTGQIPYFENKTLKNLENSGFHFFLGNQLTYSAYASGYLNKTITDNPTGNSTYYFNMETINPPLVTTTAVTDITQTTSTSGGNVTADGGAPVTVRGVCWGTATNPTVTGNHTTNGGGTGSFISYLTGLTPNTPYYVRAYASNSSGTAYGNQVLFTSAQNPTIPLVTTATVSNIALTTATGGGNVVSDGGATVSARGVCWGTTPNPTMAGNYTVDGSGTGAFISYLNGLIPNTPYCIRAYATNSLGTSYGNELTFSTLTLPTVTTVSVTNITQTTAISGGNVTADGGASVTARGVCWGTAPTPTITGTHTTDGEGTGTFISSMNALTPNTLYYIRAYATSNLGTAYGNELSFSTLPAGFTCGTSITINHVAGGVAPVTKTVTYSTVTNIPGETSKCWITSNLGADHQATAVDDATEASAGWYWQFNQKQGYKHDGTTRVPNTTWVTLIDENIDWQPANDPCILELGSGWRLPTSTEWTNVDATGGWAGWDGPWNSALKLHAAGYIYGVGGLLYNRGEYGIYWSSSQMITSEGYTLAFVSSICHVTQTGKADGHNLRCIKD